jgi:hypothetical protein
MRRSSFTLPFSILLLLATAVVPAEGQRPTLCLPAVFEGGQRLHEQSGMSVYWLELLLRQHEVCWWRSAPADAVRVFLFGNSAVFGHPVRAEETAAAQLNRHFNDRSIPAHVFNLGLIASYQLKDALIIHESLKYQPDVIVYGVTLSDFIHLAPSDWPALRQLFESSSGQLNALAQEHPPGLTQPLVTYERVLNEPGVKWARGYHFREIGRLIRTAVRHQAESLRQFFLPKYVSAQPVTQGRQLRYDCGAVKREMSEHYQDWQEWNILPYLQKIQDSAKIPVVVVNWPVTHDPVQDCYNVRYTNAVFEQYNDWIERETRMRGLRYLDLHDVLPAEDFVDSLHVGASGQRRIAERLAPVLEEAVRVRRVGAVAQK